MLTIDPKHSLLLLIDFQSRLMPAIHDGEAAIRNAKKLVEMAKLVDVPRLFTEQNAKGLGSTVEDLPVDEGRLIHKQCFDACRAEGFLERMPADGHIIVGGCEAHVCVLQTVLGLLAPSRRIFVVRNAIGSRDPEDKHAALARMARHGAEIVTAEMVVFEWLQNADHPRFRQAMTLIK
jgi:nicotinamidase-related amidase